MTAGLNKGTIRLVKVTDTYLFKIQVGNECIYNKFPKDINALTPLKITYCGKFFDLLYNGDWLSTFEFCYPNNPWEEWFWLEYDRKNKLSLPKNCIEGNWIGDVCVDRSKEYMNSYKFIGNG